MAKSTNSFLNSCLDELLKEEGQDLFMKTGSPPRIRVGNSVQALRERPVLQEDIEEIINTLLKPSQRVSLEKYKAVDFAFSPLGGYQRFRGNIFFQQGAYSAVIRRLWKNIPSFEELNVPGALKEVALKSSGIILVGGIVASGKTTTAHAMIHWINQQTKQHIITIEDPVEYLHEDLNSIVNQREIGQDAEDFTSALKYVVRQSPDVVLIGEMRDVQSFNFALTAAEIGRLVISTIHAKSVVQVIERILGFFPPEKRDAVLDHLAFHINCVAVQRLLVKKDGRTLVPAFEVLLGDPVVRDLLCAHDFEKIPQALRNANRQGMQTLDQALFHLWTAGSITAEEALSVSEKPHDLEQSMKGIRIDSMTTSILGSAD